MEAKWSVKIKYFRFKKKYIFIFLTSDLNKYWVVSFLARRGAFYVVIGSWLRRVGTTKRKKERKWANSSSSSSSRKKSVAAADKADWGRRRRRTQFKNRRSCSNSGLENQDPRARTKSESRLGTLGDDKKRDLFSLTSIRVICFRGWVSALFLLLHLSFKMWKNCLKLKEEGFEGQSFVCLVISIFEHVSDGGAAFAGRSPALGSPPVPRFVGRQYHHLGPGSPQRGGGSQTVPRGSGSPQHHCPQPATGPARTR